MEHCGVHHLVSYLHFQQLLCEQVQLYWDAIFLTPNFWSAYNWLLDVDEAAILPINIIYKVPITPESYKLPVMRLQCKN